MNETKRKPGIIDQLRAKPRRFFLVDGIGALLTIILLVAVVARFEDSFGMPGNVVYGLSILACFYAVYSFSCYLFTPRRWRPYLKLIAIANLAYCCLTMGLLFYCIQRLTILGWLYFLIEIIIIAGLALIELNTDYHDLQDRQDKVT